jgi:hypothetical protein
VRKEAQLLRHQRDAARGGVGRAPAGEAQGALIGSDRACHDLDQRRLAGAVLAEQRVHAAGANGEIGAAQGDDPAVGLANSPRLQRVHGHSIVPASLRRPGADDVFVRVGEDLVADGRKGRGNGLGARLTRDDGVDVVRAQSSPGRASSPGSVSSCRTRRRRGRGWRDSRRESGSET